MKVSELFEAYTPPVKNNKLRFSPKAGIPVGGSKEWLKAFGATPEDILQALRVVRQSGVMKELKELGLRDESTERQDKLGSITLVGQSSEHRGNGKLRTYRLKYTVQPNGKIDRTQPNDIHRAPISTGKPRIVPGDPVSSISKSMEAAMTKLVKHVQRVRADEKKAMAAADKAK